ncbi:hypothetical protein [Peribacillus muralis]|nr:hypothetical protein [Peribacillus muralis]
MPKNTKQPIISDQFLDEVVKEINEQFGRPQLHEKNERLKHLEVEERS